MIRYYHTSGAACIVCLGRMLSEYTGRHLSWRPADSDDHYARLKDSLVQYEKEVVGYLLSPSSTTLLRMLRLKRNPTVSDILRLRIVSYVSYVNLLAPFGGAHVSQVANVASIEGEMAEMLEARRQAFRLCAERVLVCRSDGDEFSGNLCIGKGLLDYFIGGNPADSLVVTEAALAKIWTHPPLITTGPPPTPESSHLPGLAVTDWKRNRAIFRELRAKVDEIVRKNKLDEAVDLIRKVTAKPRWAAVAVIVFRLMEQSSSHQTYTVSTIADEFVPANCPAECQRHLLIQERLMFERCRQVDGLEKNRRKLEMAVRRGLISNSDQEPPAEESTP